MLLVVCQSQKNGTNTFALFHESATFAKMIFVEPTPSTKQFCFLCKYDSCHEQISNIIYNEMRLK